MIHSIRFISVLDTNVLYPVDIRDLLFWFAHYDLYTPKWSATAFKEWENVMRRKGIPEKEINKRIKYANDAFPDALVTGYESLLNSLKLPDPDDNHVLAAAIKINAGIIVTNNLQDFPEEYLEKFGVKAKDADDFLTDIIDLNPDIAVEAFRRLVLNRTNPNLDEFQVLAIFRNRGLKNTADYLHSQL